jgi:hypothetical protein
MRNLLNIERIEKNENVKEKEKVINWERKIKGKSKTTTLKK